MPVQVLIYDDSEALRESLWDMLSEDSDIEVLAMMDNAQTVERDLAALKPDVVLMDIDMPEVDGVTAVKRIRKINDQLPVSMLTVFDDSEKIFSAVYAGATGYLLKQFAPSEVTAAIHNVMSGGSPMTGPEQEKTNLNERETEILRLLVDGFSYKMIGDRIGISIDGVRFHIRKIYEKLHVHSATEAVSKAIRDRLV
jgi:DNA-binding NarL/FixJ family response regulator